MAAILFLDVDGAPFLSFEMVSLLRRGHAVSVASFRAIPEELRSGELAPLAKCEVRLARGGSALAYYLAAKPAITLSTLATALAAHAREPGPLAKLLASLGWTFGAARWAAEHRIEHVHANWAHLPATSAWIVSRLTGIPFSFSGHAGRDLFRSAAFLPRKARDARFIVVCNDAARAQIARVSGDDRNVRLRYHGVDLERFRSGARSGDGFLLSVGNLDPAKGFDVMIEALALLSRRDLRYVIAGDGEERGRLAALAARLGVADRVELRGRVTGEALVQAYRDAAALVVPSRILQNGGRDGLPNVVLEAMAVGTPVIGAGVAALPEAIEHERTGLLVPVEDPAALAAAIERLLCDPALAARLAAAARERVVHDFDRTQAARALCDLFAAELGEAGRGPEAGRAAADRS